MVLVLPVGSSLEQTLAAAIKKKYGLQRLNLNVTETSF